MPLALEDVRLAAREAGLQELYHNAASAVVSFSGAGLNRINVYWTTGTVATCIVHPRQGPTQLFRRNMSLPGLRELMREPRTHTGAGYHRKRSGVQAGLSQGGVDLPGNRSCRRQEDQAAGGDDQEETGANRNEVGMDPADEETEARAQRARLQQELAEVEAVLAEHERRRQQKAAERAATEAQRQREAQAQRKAEAALARQAVAKARGTRMAYWLTGDNIETADDWNGHTTTCIAMGSCEGPGSPAVLLFLTESGFSHSGGLPDAVHYELQGKHRFNMRYVALGTEGRYFMTRNTGWQQWQGPTDFGDYINTEAQTGVEKVAFGADYGSWFVLTSDGGFGYSGAPTGFKEAQNSNKYKKKTVADVSWGPNGEWWIKWTDGSWKANGLEDSCNDQIAELQRNDRDIKTIVLGPNSEWLMRYE